VNGGEDAELAVLLAGEAEDVGEQVVLSLECEAVRRAVAALPEPSREVVKRRFGINVTRGRKVTP
jgi:DNA-directed RNA polymerase specialized sigma24 family protein